MLREITLGQYYPEESVIHKLDPRVKLFATMVYMIALFVGNAYIHFVISIAAFLTIVYLSKIPLRYILRGLKFIFIIMIMSAVCNALFTDGEVIWHYGWLKLTYEGINKAIFISVRLILLVLGTSLLTLTTTPTALTDGLERSLGFLSKIKIPIHEIAMMMSIALRFIPILMEETDKIMKAQTARGADFHSGSIFHRIKMLIPIIIPLFVAAFRRANELATAMDARCYVGGDSRTKYHPLKYKKRDWLAYGFILIYVVAFVALRILY